MERDCFEGIFDAPMIFQGYGKEKKKKNRQSEVLIR